MEIDDGIPLLVRRPMDHAVPREAGVVNDDVDLAIAELGGFLDELVYVGVDEDVAGDCDRAAAGLVDLAGYVRGFVW